MAKQNKNSKSAEKQEKNDRLSQALRDNLLRRKAQARKTNTSESKEDK